MLKITNTLQLKIILLLDKCEGKTITEISNTLSLERHKISNQVDFLRQEKIVFRKVIDKQYKYFLTELSLSQILPYIRLYSIKKEVNDFNE